MALVLSACSGESPPQTTPSPGSGTSPETTPSPQATPSPEAADPTDTTVVLLNDLDEEVGRDASAEMAQIIAFFEERFGLSVRGITVYLAADAQTLADAYYEATGHRYAHVLCISDQKPAIFLVHHLCRHDGYLVLDHEYFHLLQARLVEFSDDPEAYRRAVGPRWLTEGVAEYAATLYRAETGSQTYADLRDTYLLAAASWAGTLRESSEPIGREHYYLGFLAAEYLVERAGEGALLEYYRQISPHTPWQDVFQDVFGIDIDPFYRDFEEHRAENRPPYNTISGTVRGPDGKGIADIGLWAWTGDRASSSSGGTAANGDFVLAVPGDGRFTILIYVPPRGSCTFIGRYEEDTGFTSSQSDATRIDVRGDDVTGIVVRLPEGWEQIPYIEHCAR